MQHIEPDFKYDLKDKECRKYELVLTKCTVQYALYF